MPRPRKARWISIHPGSLYFKPQGVPLSFLDSVLIELDELEAIQLADLEGMSQEEGAGRMNISRATFGRIIARARRKMAEAMVYGKAIRIEGPGGFFPVTGPGGHHGHGPHGRGRGRWYRP